MNKCMLSIVIPTKNRQDYCLFAVKQIISLGLQNIEVCIQDNSDTDELRKEIENLRATNIVYNYHGGVLSFVDNFSEAISISSGEYVCIIGDDDGILPNIINYVKKAEVENLDAIIPSLGIVYIWPSEEKIIDNAESGLLHLCIAKPCNSRSVNPPKALNTLLHNAIQDYTSLDIPRLYHGIVKRSVLESIKQKTGAYFKGLTPDMYMAVALAIECKNVIRIDESITISGICPKSGSADSVTGKHTGELSEAPHFRGHNSYVWDSRIPSFYSVDTIWAETLIQALVSLGRDDLIDKFNLSLFESICAYRYPEYSQLIRNHSIEHNISFLSLKIEYPLFCIRTFFKRVIRRIIRDIKKIFGYKMYIAHMNNIPNIIEAEMLIKEAKIDIDR